jgi:pyruvate-formate lyase-activating enzyme
MTSLGMKLTGDQLTDFQTHSLSHIVVSITEACNLRCSHCIARTDPKNERTGRLSPENTKKFASQFPALKTAGVHFITFIGGEPFLAPESLSELSQAAHEAGIKTAVVTSGYWASSRSRAEKILDAFSSIDTWHLSTDAFHERFVPLDTIIHAAEAVSSRGKNAVIRVATSDTTDEKNTSLCEKLHKRLPENIPVLLQPVVNIHCGVIEHQSMKNMKNWPCVPIGMGLRYDGTISPCCSGLFYESVHPFHYVNAVEKGIVTAYKEWRSDPLMQLMRGAGFLPILSWIADTFPEHEILKKPLRHPCECCIQLWKDPLISLEIRRRAELPGNREKIRQLHATLFCDAERNSPETG